MNAEVWVTVGFLIFLGLLAWQGVHSTILKGLDGRAARIAGELADASRLRAEAEKLLREFEAKRAAAEKEAEAIVHDAREEAARLKADAEAKLADYVTRRAAQAEQKIAQAEMLATAEVRASAADAAIKAAEAILRGATGQAAADALIAKGIAEAKAKLN